MWNRKLLRTASNVPTTVPQYPHCTSFCAQLAREPELGQASACEAGAWATSQSQAAAARHLMMASSDPLASSQSTQTMLKQDGQLKSAAVGRITNPLRPWPRRILTSTHALSASSASLSYSTSGSAALSVSLSVLPSLIASAGGACAGVAVAAADAVVDAAAEGVAETPALATPTSRCPLSSSVSSKACARASARVW